MVPCHRAEQLQGLLDMPQLLGIGGVTVVFTHLHKVIRYDTEVALKELYLFPGQPGNLKDVDPVIADVGPEPLRDVQPLQQAFGLVPPLLIPKIQHKGENRVSSALCLFYYTPNPVQNQRQFYDKKQNCLKKTDETVLFFCF